ncbi:DUF1653 domain-containing protein [Candidatus Sulfurimonas marisnigri]|uniref:DUF1653 domain-containing protein n=1 Tax=Candidatus Sulfurimonas marisnigri TaxID=2740405 RepID=A0A7S7LZ46_9BACT|nr:DUF1653 domain-containing protein [Candidatus Sulfurimonas marisnigri]QOY54130.1 DUF1653 domain-containing protein [Candidatus Sulfurimonas marisnigri]
MKTGIYEHYKGNRYEVIDTLRHSETEVLMVLYRTMYGDEDLWARPYNMFFEEVEVDNKLVPRFKYIGKKSV